MAIDAHNRFVWLECVNCILPSINPCCYHTRRCIQIVYFKEFNLTQITDLFILFRVFMDQRFYCCYILQKYIYFCSAFKAFPYAESMHHWLLIIEFTLCYLNYFYPVLHTGYKSNFVRCLFNLPEVIRYRPTEFI